MAEAAQRVYDEWVSEDDDDFEGGICDEIASAIQEVIANNLDDAEITEGGHDGDDHAWTLVSDGKLVYEVDIPPHVYEHGSGYSWSKIEGVRFKSSDVIISKIDARYDQVFEEILKRGGKPIRFLHGTTKDFAEFKPGKHKRTMQLGFGIHFTEDPKLASHYTGYQDITKTGSKPGGHIKMVNLDVKKALDVTKIYDVGSPEHEFAVELCKGTGRKPIVDGGKVFVNLDVTSPARAEKLLRKYGYDAVIYDAKVGRRTLSTSGRGFHTDIEAKSILVLDPSQVKPAYIKESEDEDEFPEVAWISKNGKVYDAGGDSHQEHAAYLLDMTNEKQATRTLYDRGYITLRGHVVRAMAKVAKTKGFMKAISLAAHNAAHDHLEVYVETFEKPPIGGGVEEADYAFEFDPKDAGRFLQRFDGRRAPGFAS